MSNRNSNKRHNATPPSATPPPASAAGNRATVKPRPNATPTRQNNATLPIIVGAVVLLLLAAVLLFTTLSSTPSPTPNQAQTISTPAPPAGQSALGAPTGTPLTSATLSYRAMAFKPDDPNTVYLAYEKGMLRSTDSGATWQQLAERQQFNPQAMVIDPTNPNLMYVGGFGPLQQSSDGGRTWQSLTTNLPSDAKIYSLSINPDKPTVMQALIIGYGAYNSSDAGKTWQPFTNALEGTEMNVVSLGGEPETVYAANMNYGFLKSNPDNKGWKVVALNPPGAAHMYSIAYDKSNRSTIYVGADNGVYKSTEQVVKWVKTSFPAENVFAVAVSPVQPSRVLGLTVQNKTGLLYRSEDAGATWGTPITLPITFEPITLSVKK